MTDHAQNLRDLASVEKSCLFSQRQKLNEAADYLDDLQAAYDDTRRLAREIDVALSGEDGAAQQASLCDLVSPAKALRTALEEIVDPIRFMQARLKDDEKLDGMAAVMCRDDPEYLRGIARDALKPSGKANGESE